MTAPAIEFHFDPQRPSPYIIEMDADDDGNPVAIVAFLDIMNIKRMPLDQFLTLLREHYPWTIESVERCPTCGR
jgi:hypothetical protein